MPNTHDRYTDNDLIRMLQIAVSDYNKQPTQREVLADDRLPTHHTYRKRFGTLAAALEAAGLSRVPKESSHLHDTLREVVDTMGTVREWVPVGSMMVDFEVTTPGGSTILIDLVDLEHWTDEDTLKQIIKMRWAIADAYADGREYTLFTNAMEAIKHIAVLV